MSEHNTNDLLHLFDKHLKAGDNFLPLKAFLQFIEKPEGDLNGFRALSTAKIPNLPRNPEPEKSQNIASTTKLIQKNPETDDPILAHILYKVIITVDYWPQSSSLDFIEKSLYVIFDKISHEFDQFYSNCVNTEPQIYVTVLLWNSSPNSPSQNQHPFSTIIHSKRLLKTNLSQMAAFIFNKVIENKSIILESFKKSRAELRINTSIDEEIYSKPKTKSPYEEFLRILTKIFNFFEINPITATSLVLAHHVHITDGFIYASDMVRCLEKISKSAISFSFVYAGTSSHKSESNILSSFGHMVNCTFMQNLANMTNGFCYYLDENLEISEIVPRGFFYFFNLKFLDLQLKESNWRRKKKCSDDLNDLRHILSNDIVLGQVDEYELPKDLDLMQFIRIRAQEGFFLANLTRQFDESESVLINIYLKKVFTQTVSVVYKIKSALSSKCILQLWIAWDSVQFKAKHQNVDSLRKLKQFFNQISSSMQKYQFELTASMREAPEILSKYKEPLYKLSNEIMNEDHYQKNTFSLQNLNFELNNRTIKNHEVDYYNEYAHSWSYLSFFKLHPKALGRYFAIHSIKMLLHHDRPVPDINSCIFDLKTRSSLDSFNPNYIPNSVFQSTKAINELRSLLTTWCDIMLVENCIFLKFFHSSMHYLRPGEMLEDSQESESADDSKEKLSDTNNSVNSNNLASKNSFVICIVSDQYAPFVSLQFLFHSNIYFIDRMRILESFKDMLRNLNFKKDKEVNLKENSAKKLEQISLLQKTHLYDAFKFILFDEIQNNSDPKLNQSSKLVYFMLRKKFKWTLENNFSAQTAQNLKETLIDTFIRMRMKEGFRCLFQCSKFVAFTLQLTMLDSTESQNSRYKSGSAQTCTYIYVIRFHKNENSNLLNVAVPAQIETIPNTEIYFVTEIYAEAIDGVYQERARKKDRIDYFKNLTNNEILNMIYLQDYKCFSILQSSSALFLSKNNLYENLNGLISKSELTKAIKIEDSELKEMLNKILDFEDKFYDCIRLVPDLNVILYKHLLKELGKKSTLVNPVSQCLLNRVNYQTKSHGRKDTQNQLSGNLTSDSEGVPIKKKNVPISLYEQLRPVLSSIDVSRYSLNQVDFKFSLKGILIESSLFVCVYDDIPFNLFNSNSDDGFKKIQQYFFHNVDETFRKIDDSKDNTLFQSVVRKIKSDVKNSLMLKLNDIKTGDLITKRILEHLRQTENYDSFKIFIKFNLHQTTSKNCYPSPSSSNYNRASSTHKSNPWMSQSQIINPQFDIENNKLYIYGLFFINADASSDQCEPRVQDSNRLVFFLFNSVSESLKTSLIHTQSNSYLIRKSLFTTSNSSEHKFYISKNTIAKAASHQDLKSQQIQLRKLSDILKQNLSLSSQNDGSFLSMIDLIEENCAKTYVNSIVHFLASDVGDGVSIDKSTVQRLLRLGAKTKITDIDLTDYVRITCRHLQGHEAEEPCSAQQTSYLQQKFEQIFLKRFQTIPGFHDLFVIQSDYFKDVDMLPPAEYSNDDDFSPSEETEENEAESDDLEANFLDSDANDLTKKKKRRKKKIDSSSPYSNLTKNISSTESFFVAKEQVIGIEVICQVSCDPDSDLVESRTRTTTLTADNNELDDSMGAPSIPAQCSHSFASKFVKFDFNCVLKLIDSREMPPFKSPTSKINLNEVTNSLKILLRFNWYSFNELNLNYPLNIFAASNSAQANTAPNLSNHSSTNTQINFENFSYLEPCLNDLKWHLKDELLNSQASIDSAKTFSQYVIHIKQGVEAAIVNCSKYSKKIVLSKVTTSKFNSGVDKSSKLNSALLQNRPPKLFTTTQTEEDKSLISVDPGKFFAELSSLLLSLNFYASKVQQLNSNFFFLDCSGQQVGFKIFLIVRLFDKREVTNGRNNKSSPSQSQEGGSSPNSQLKTSLQKQSTNELQKLSLPKNSLVYQETNISQLKMSAYFSFNHSDLSVKQDQHASKKEIVDEFESQMKTLVRLCYLKITLKDINESHKWNNSLVLTEDKNLSFSDSLSNSLSCSCVWSVYFKLHRLHQTLQKVHETNNYISQGLSKLRDCLHNFKIYESACADLYVYTKNTNDVFLLKLDEVYDDEERRQSSMLSRRPSYASINDSEQTIISSRNTSSQGLKSQNLSGGTHRIETQTSLTQTQAKLTPPEYVRLSVYGLEEPDDEMKKDLCKTLQAELDYCLLNRMSNSIEKNTYKTTSQQHPDKINDEDINFFKQASDSVFDYEVALPFLFNFNRTLREMFFFFIKQVFYANFKSIDPSQAKASNADSQDQKYSNSQLSLFYIPESKHFAKKNSDTSLADAILISRIFFQNSKSKRIGKQNVSLILVEAFYSICGLDTSTNRVTRSNSMGASSIKFEHDIIDKKLRQTGPSFVFKFYSKGETAEIINCKLLLRKAVRDALTYFLSDYITRVDPVDYTKKILLKKQPAKFRVLDSDFLTSKLHRKRHKSTGATELSSNKQFLQMNKAARESRLGRVLVSQNITDTAQFNSFVITNFSLNTFDHKDHEDTLQYFKQPRRMMNMSNEEYDSDESITSDSDEEINLYKVQRSISMEPELEKIHLDRLSNEKSYLKLIYDWLKGVHSNQTSSLGSFLLRKQFLYRTKYNLTNLVKDFEMFVKEMCKCDLGVNFFSFKKDGPKDSSRLNDSVFLDEDDFDVDEFANLKISKLSMVNSNLTKGENVIVTINAEYGGLSGFSSMSSSMNSSSSNQNTKIFSSGNSSSTLVQSSSSTTMSTVMVKSISSANGDSELPSNQSVSSQNLKRTFCFIIVNAKTKFVTFCCFTTESSNYDSLKQWLDQSAEIITQRFHLVNNTVLYKFGGLIGDNIITDLKKVKQLAICSTCGFTEASSASQSDLFSSETKQHPQRTQLSSIKLSKSPTIHRQSSTTKPLSSPINPALIANLQFNSANFSLATGASTPSQSSAAHQQTAFSLKQLYMTPIGVKSYDIIATNINQQVNFCVQNLGQQTPSTTDFSIISPSNAKFLSQGMKSQCLYGVGMCYQLLEMQQIYRHPRKIYELAIGSGSLQNISPNSQNNLKPQSTKAQNTSNTNLVSPNNQLGYKFSLSDFYKNSIQPVFIPFHYCCTPLLFYSNWTESITNEKMLKSSNIKPTKTNTAITNNENWYFKMRQIVLVEYSKYFESKDFVRLRDDRQIQESRIGQTDSQMLHFIKWLQQDGFLYLTINLDEIYLHVRVGVCSRYRSSNRQSFISEIVRFLTQDFHVHSFIYDFHLSAINSNFLSTSQSGMQISQTSYIVSKFLDEFVEFFSRVPLYSQNKVFKLVYEKADNSLKQNQYTIIFDFISYANKKLGMGNISFQTLHTFGNNLTIYSLTDSSNSSKYLIVKLEQFSKEVLRNKLNSSQNMSKSSSVAGAEKSRVENFIRITCFYLFINKSSELGMFASQGVMNGLNNDLEFINKVIEESVSMHRQKVFWDNLALSMNVNKGELKNLIEISEVELEQILTISERVNVLELDPGLDEFLKQCYQIKEKIKDYFRLELSRNFIYTESDTIEYCLLIVTDSLISSFKSDQGQEQNGSESSLRSFILVKFDKIKCITELFQVNRVKIVDLGGKQSDASNMLRENSLAGKEISQVINSLYGSKIFKSFGFIINILLCTLWNSLF